MARPRSTPLAVRRILSPRTPAREGPSSAFLGRPGGLALGFALLGLLAIASGWGLLQGFQSLRQRVAQAAFQPHWAPFSGAFLERWTSAPEVPPFCRGDEAPLRRLLAEQPLLEAIVSRTGPRSRIWVRQGERLVPCTDPERRTRIESLLRPFTGRRTGMAFPSSREDPELGRALTGLTLTPRWALLRRAEPGSEALERELRILLGPHPAIRVGLLYLGMAGQPRPPFRRLPDTTHQCRLVPEAPPLFFHVYWSRQYTEGWSWQLSPAPHLRARLHRMLWTRAALMGLPFALLAGLLGLWAGLRRAARRREALARDCLAALTHGLQTPLALLKARCDALRLRRLGEVDERRELNHLGEEIELLSRLVAHGMEAIQESEGIRSSGTVTLRWQHALAEAFRPLLAREDRNLRTGLEGEGGRAGLASLRQVLWILLENAMKHGCGTVAFASRREDGRLVLSVQDEGPGLEPGQLEELGRPCPRFRAPGAPGLGLGLSLALQIAEQEGWGLRFCSAPGTGLCVELELSLP